MMKEKIYVGVGRLKERKWGPELVFGFNALDLQKMRDNLSPKGWVSMTVHRRKEPKGDITHFGTINLFTDSREAVPVFRDPESGELVPGKEDKAGFDAQKNNAGVDDGKLPF